MILVADDLGWKDVGFHGAEFRTPHIDRIAREGVELWRFYVAPVCSPTRVALVTGRHPIRFGLQRSTIKPWTALGIPPQEQTLAELLERAGYRRRGVFGKWHLGESKQFHPLKQGFSHFVGHYGGAIDYFRHLRLGALDWHHGFDLSREQGYSTELIGGHAAQFVRETPIGEPFLLYVPFNAIHGPNHATKEHLDRNAHIEPGKRRLKAAMMTAMDDAVGRILDALEDRQEADSTLVLFFGDNGGGPPQGSSNEPLRGRKHTVYEGGVRVAAAARWPDGGISGGHRIEAPVSVLDMLPTIARISGLDEEELPDSDGADVTSILHGQTRDRGDFEFISYFNGKNIPGNFELSDTDRRELGAVVSDKWKLVRLGPNLDTAANPEAGSKLELFDLRRDPYESNDVSKSQPQVVARLLAKLVKYRRLKPNDAPPIPLVEPEGWSPPKDWRVAK